MPAGRPSRRDGCLFVRLPSETARTIGVPERTAFTFDPGADHSVHLLASGSALLDAMIHVTRGEGRVHSSSSRASPCSARWRRSWPGNAKRCLGRARYTCLYRA